jgi:two-component system, LuxR family, sensor kinase FixL
LNVTMIDIRVLLAEVISSFSDRAVRLGVRFTQDIRIAREVPADRTQLQMVLHNLLSNALEALADSPAGDRRIIVTATMEDQRVKLTIEDTGRGVSPDIRGQLFEPFVTNKFDGMGLGLAISRSLLRSQGGELRLDGSNDEGSRAGGARFVVELPLAAASNAA